MSMGINDLIAAAESDEQLKAKLSAAQSVEDLKVLAADNGYDVTVAELTEALTPEREVTDAELESVAGGAESGLGVYGICSAGFTQGPLPTVCR